MSQEEYEEGYELDADVWYQLLTLPIDDKVKLLKQYFVYDTTNLKDLHNILHLAQAFKLLSDNPLKIINEIKAAFTNEALRARVIDSEVAFYMVAKYFDLMNKFLASRYNFYMKEASALQPVEIRDQQKLFDYFNLKLGGVKMTLNRPSWWATGWYKAYTSQPVTSIDVERYMEAHPQLLIPEPEPSKKRKMVDKAPTLKPIGVPLKVQDNAQVRSILQKFNQPAEEYDTLYDLIEKLLLINVNQPTNELVGQLQEQLQQSLSTNSQLEVTVADLRSKLQNVSNVSINTIQGLKDKAEADESIKQQLQATIAKHEEDNQVLTLKLQQSQAAEVELQQKLSLLQHQLEQATVAFQKSQEELEQQAQLQQVQPVSEAVQIMEDAEDMFIVPETPHQEQTSVQRQFTPQPSQAEDTSMQAVCSFNPEDDLSRQMTTLSCGPNEACKIDDTTGQGVCVPLSTLSEDQVQTITFNNQQVLLTGELRTEIYKAMTKKIERLQELEEKIPAPIPLAPKKSTIRELAEKLKQLHQPFPVSKVSELPKRASTILSNTSQIAIMNKCKAVLRAKV